MQATQGSIRVWDLPTRLFHWSLVLAVFASFITGQIGGAWMDWHGYSGLAIVGLLVFRLIWGVLGPSSSRFSSFVRGPRAVIADLRGHWRGFGHSPLGAIAVLALLSLLGVQVVTGLYANDDIAFQGPLSDLVSKSDSDSMRALHSRVFYLLAALVSLHVGAILFYLCARRNNLIRPMLTGWKPLDATLSPAPQIASGRGVRIASLLLAMVLAALAMHAANGGFVAAPLPQAGPAQAPAW